MSLSENRKKVRYGTEARILEFLLRGPPESKSESRATPGPPPSASHTGGWLPCVFCRSYKTRRPVKPAVHVNDGSSQIDAQPSFMLACVVVPHSCSRSYFPGTAAERLRGRAEPKKQAGLSSHLCLTLTQPKYRGCGSQVDMCS